MAETPPEGFSLLPADDEGIAPVADLDAAEASALEDPLLQEDMEEAPIPLGRTILYDFQEGRAIRSGEAPTWTRGTGALEMWCLMAIYTAQYAHPVFTPAFGTERPYEPLGETDVGELVDDYGARIAEALLVHDRVSEVENFSATWDPAEGVLYINSLDVVTDEETLRLGDLSVDTLPEGNG